MWYHLINTQGSNYYHISVFKAFVEESENKGTSLLMNDNDWCFMHLSKICGLHIGHHCFMW